MLTISSTSDEDKFQSQNGLILTTSLAISIIAGVSFQSQNGLILTHTACNIKINKNRISIPKWSYFNEDITKKNRRYEKISIPKWSYFN